MKVLGVEATAHTLGIGIVEDEDGFCALANERRMVPIKAGGIHPREAAAHHADVADEVLAAALAEAQVRVDELDAIAFSQGPGLGPCLRVAATLARALALRLDKPLVGVNHCVAHLEVGAAITGATDPVLLYASGANTQIIAKARGRYRVFGETLDVGIGNALDKFAREQGIAFPGGPEIERLAKGGGYVELPYTVKGMDLSFSGLATAASRAVADGAPLRDVCYSLQETAFAALVEVAERALAFTGKDELLLGGGVACNARLQAMAQMMCAARGARSLCPPREFLVDNGAMIAWTGARFLRTRGATPIGESAVRPHERTDMVEVPWA